jgi:tetratricopeptide (TPR) repeat protein
MEANLKGLGHMERYEYLAAAEQFQKVHDLAPAWLPGSINWAIALLNAQGEAEAKKKEQQTGAAGATTAGSIEAADRAKGGQQKATVEQAENNFEKALALFDNVLKSDPENLHAHYCRGLILEKKGELERAHQDFQFVVKRDPTDGYSWWKLGTTLTDPARPGMPATLKQANELIEIYTTAVKCNPYLVPALYKLQEASRWGRKLDDQKRVFELWKRLNPEQLVTGSGDVSKDRYGEMGRHALVIELDSARKGAEQSVPPPRFSEPRELTVTLPAGHRWVRESDFTGPLAIYRRARARFGPAIAIFDVNGDKSLDIFLAASVVAPDGIRDCLLINRGNGGFEDVTAKFGLPARQVSLGAAAGDFDADGHIDLFLTGVGTNVLLRNLGKEKGFEDVSKALGSSSPPAVSLSARWLDLDQDGDLDLYVINYTAAENADTALTDKTPAGLGNGAYRNDGKPAPMPGPENGWAPPAVSTGDKPEKGLSVAFTPWDGDGGKALLAGDAPHTAIAALDIDNDRDTDLVLAADGAVPTILMNDRLGRFRAIAYSDLKTPDPISGLAVLDVDRDSHADLAAVPVRGRVSIWRNRTPNSTGMVDTPLAFEFWPTDAHDWRAAQVVDLDLDGASDFLGLPAVAADAAPEWARNAGNRLATLQIALGPDTLKPLQGLAIADLAADPLPDLLLLRDGEGPRLARNLGNGQHWLALDVRGQWKLGPQYGPMRTNPQGLGARILLQGLTLRNFYNHTTPESGLAQSVGPVVLGVGENTSVNLIRLLWPDGVIQCEMEAKVDQKHDMREICRKTGSCPVLFTWDGERFVCIGDFLGGGGLGYLVAPGVYSQPDRDEAVAIAPDQLAEVGGVYYISVMEPMDELAYLDHLQLEVVDRPPGVQTVLDERFAPRGNRPTGKVVAWSTAIEPVKATDLSGRDVTDKLRHWDRRTVDGFKRLRQWIGYAEEHGIVLDFGDRLDALGETDPVVLCLAGWVEYPYSQTNYAASTAGLALKPPMLERLQDDGSWSVIEADPGYPAGMPRMTSLDLTGKLTGANCVIRLRTNMECYWDQAFLARPIPNERSRVKSTTLPVNKATLGDRGYTREISPDGRLPLVYDYEHVDPAPLARLIGNLTRYGDVAPLLRKDDDQLCLVGPGDEVRIEFDAKSVPPLQAGWTRSFVLRAAGYCKDADPFTATSDTIGPMPWKGMGPYPFGSDGERPADPAYRAYLREYQTRVIGN